MNEPRGFNPVGDHAAGLPQHDRQLPGHVSGGGFANIGGGEEVSSPVVSAGGGAYPEWFGIWSARVILYVTMYITVPIQVALYPIAGAAGVLVGGLVYLVSGSLDWAWTGCFIGLVALMRTEIGIEEKNPGYREKRHWVRLVLVFAWFVYFMVREQGDGIGKAIFLAAIITGIAHLLLNWGIARGLWDRLQTIGWLRSGPLGYGNRLV
jgi:hypothetical protein